MFSFVRKFVINVKVNFVLFFVLQEKLFFRYFQIFAHIALCADAKRGRRGEIIYGGRGGGD